MSILVPPPDLKPAASEDDYRLHCDALEWSLAEPILITDAEDIRSRVDWKDRVEPFEHQVRNLIRFCRRLPVTLLADDVGLGKTISAGLILAELMKRSRVRRTFVICPKILVPQWVEELGSKFGIEAIAATGSALRRIEGRRESVIVTTYHSATTFLDRDRSGVFDMLILDEAHKLRNLHGPGNPPKMATSIYRALQNRTFKYVLMLTATPIQNRLWDIYSLIDCLSAARGHRNPFGTPEQFADRYVADSRMHARQLVPALATEFRGIVGTYMFRTRRIDAKLVFPEREVVRIECDATKEEQSILSIVRNYLGDFNPLQQTSLLVALMSSPHALRAQLANMAKGGTASQDFEREVTQLTERIGLPAKASQLLALIEQLKGNRSGWRVVVFTTRSETQEMLGKVLRSRGIACGFVSGASTEQNRRSIEAFRREPPEVNVIISTDAGAEGVNLQVSNVLVNYDLPWNPMIVEQRIGRVQRIGSRYAKVLVANLVHRNAPDGAIVERLMEKLQTIAHTVGDIEAVLEAANDADGEGITNRIREMVIASLRGQDQTRATRMVEENIASAKRLIEQSQEEVDRTLGGSVDDDRGDVPMPKLTPRPPSTPLQTFVLKALKAEGAEITDLGGGLFSMRSGSAHEERFAFDDKTLARSTQGGVFLGRTPLDFRQGRPAFERLVQRWLDRSSAWVIDHPADAVPATDAARQWAASYPSILVKRIEADRDRSRLQGEVVVRLRVSNAIDSFEKLAVFPFGTEWEGRSTDRTARGRDATEIVDKLRPTIVAGAERDPDISKFRDYYARRLQIESSRSDGGERLKKLQTDLSLQLSAEPVGLRSEQSRVMSIAVEFSVGSEMHYVANLMMESGRIITKPADGQCELTDRTLPETCLETCALTGRRALRELLIRSEESGRYGSPSVIVRCALTGRQLLNDEVERCSRSGNLISRSSLLASAVSGKLASPEFFERCEITGDPVFAEELDRSDLSQRRCRADQLVVTSEGRRGHQSEVEYCEFTDRHYPTDDCRRSDVSGKPFPKVRSAISESSGRIGDQSEGCRCEATGRLLLCDEVGVSDVSGKRVEAVLLHRCVETNKLALQSEMLPVEPLGSFALPSATDVCTRTGLRLRRSQLGYSDLSRKPIRRDLLVTCGRSGMKLLPDETGVSDLTGTRLDRRLLEHCSETGKLVERERLVTCEFSGKRILVDRSFRLPNGQVVSKRETGFCRWTRRWMKASEVAVCQLTGVTIATRFLNSSGEFSLVRQALDGKRHGFQFQEVEFLTRLDAKYFEKLSDVQWLSADHLGTHLVFGTRSFWGLGIKPECFALLVEGASGNLQPVGNAVWGKRSKGTCVVTESRRFGE
ncbi:MAG TPA: SNF2-related protein [Pirellulaceae bacterium]|nr:SNF2-related protein [Pirellulaceae bacterium]